MNPFKASDFLDETFLIFLKMQITLKRTYNVVFCLCHKDLAENQPAGCVMK